jgi:hypothetical protein
MRRRGNHFRVIGRRPPAPRELLRELFQMTSGGQRV